MLHDSRYRAVHSREREIQVPENMKYGTNILRSWVKRSSTGAIHLQSSTGEITLHRFKENARWPSGDTIKIIFEPEGSSRLIHGEMIVYFANSFIESNSGHAREIAEAIYEVIHNRSLNR